MLNLASVTLNRAKTQQSPPYVSMAMLKVVSWMDGEVGQCLIEHSLRLGHLGMQMSDFGAEHRRAPGTSHVAKPPRLHVYNGYYGDVHVLDGLGSCEA